MNENKYNNMRACYLEHPDFTTLPSDKRHLPICVPITIVNVEFSEHQRIRLARAIHTFLLPHSHLSHVTHFGAHIGTKSIRIHRVRTLSPYTRVPMCRAERKDTPLWMKRKGIYFFE
mgnify:CR=1 FL=1